MAERVDRYGFPQRLGETQLASEWVIAPDNLSQVTTVKIVPNSKRDQGAKILDIIQHEADREVVFYGTGNNPASKALAMLYKVSKDLRRHDLRGLEPRFYLTRTPNRKVAVIVRLERNRVE